MGRPPGPTLNQDKVVRAARELAETRVADLSMTGLAELLGVTPMALYRHVRNKQDLLALVLDDVLSEVAVPDLDAGDWSDRLRIFHADVMGALARLPGISDHFHQIPQTPNAGRLLAGYLGILLDSGITERQAILAYTTLYYLAIGSLYTDNIRRAGSLPTTPAADPPNYPAPILHRIKAQAAMVETADVREYGVEAVITLVAKQAAPRVRRKPRRAASSR